MPIEELSMITLFVEFFVNDIFGHVFLSVLFLVGIIMGILWYARVPKIGISIIGLAVMSTLSKSGYVPVWVGIMLWVILGLLWGTMFIKLVR